MAAIVGIPPPQPCVSGTSLFAAAAAAVAGCADAAAPAAPDAVVATVGFVDGPWRDALVGVEYHAHLALALWGSGTECSAEALQHFLKARAASLLVPRDVLDGCQRLRLVASMVQVLDIIGTSPGPALVAAARAWADSVARLLTPATRSTTSSPRATALAASTEHPVAPSALVAEEAAAAAAAARAPVAKAAVASLKGWMETLRAVRDATAVVGLSAADGAQAVEPQGVLAACGGTAAMNVGTDGDFKSRGFGSCATGSEVKALLKQVIAAVRLIETHALEPPPGVTSSDEEDSDAEGNDPPAHVEEPMQPDSPPSSSQRSSLDTSVSTVAQLGGCGSDPRGSALSVKEEVAAAAVTAAVVAVATATVAEGSSRAAVGHAMERIHAARSRSPCARRQAVIVQGASGSGGMAGISNVIGVVQHHDARHRGDEHAAASGDSCEGFVAVRPGLVDENIQTHTPPLSPPALAAALSAVAADPLSPVPSPVTKSAVAATVLPAPTPTMEPILGASLPSPRAPPASWLRSSGSAASNGRSNDLFFSPVASDIPIVMPRSYKTWSAEDTQRLQEGYSRYGPQWRIIRTACGLSHKSSKELYEKHREFERRRARRCGD
eukprot:TRINITY_DN62209_c0_g1_i1.p1 TRINITY_DN62209_c0_g1~~TRINITY_DN62209_c0_g1_i1.p1  ORF type:complete len:610 (+),score=122.27 TRINITY_DN62209_c0_g1_i1:210-2039(+)